MKQTILSAARRLEIDIYLYHSRNIHSRKQYIFEGPFLNLLQQKKTIVYCQFQTEFAKKAHKMNARTHRVPSSKHLLLGLDGTWVCLCMVRGSIIVCIHKGLHCYM